MTPEEQNILDRFVHLTTEELADWDVLAEAASISDMPHLPLAVLKQLLSVPWPDVRINAIDRLGESDFPEACDLLIAAFEDESPSV